MPWTNGRGQVLHTVEVLPDTANIQAVLIFHHGYGEHTGRYQRAFGQLARDGIAVHAYDCHGHGLSEPKDVEDRVLVWNFNDLVDDLERFGAHIREQYGSRYPVFVGGQSMGSLVSVHAVLRDQSVWDGLVLATATLDVEWNTTRRIQALAGTLLSKLLPRLRVVPAVRDAAAEAAMLEVVGEKGHLEEHHMHSFVVNEFEDEVWPMRARTANETLKGFAHVRREGHRLHLPIYAHHGTADILADIKAVKRLLAASASRDVTMVEVEKGEHELFMGKHWMSVTKALTEWMLNAAQRREEVPT